MMFRLRYHVAGEHFRIRLFVGEREDALVYTGTLTFRIAEFQALIADVGKLDNWTFVDESPQTEPRR